MIKSISFIGAGNVSTHFAKAFYKANIQIDSILSLRLSTAKQLATKVKAKATTSYKRLSKESDLYIIAVPDDMIQNVIHSLQKVLDDSVFIVHTSGATPISVFNHFFKNAGVLWPPQSLSKQKDIDFASVPICYGGLNESTKNVLLHLVKKLSNHFQDVNEKQKLALHLAAVFTNNFSNHMFHIAYKICQQHKLDFSLLSPIILETAQKVIHENPGTMQTGPAVRNDRLTQQKHKALLKGQDDFAKLYSLISKSIQVHKIKS